jgi:hypothetical protein
MYGAELGVAEQVELEVVLAALANSQVILAVLDYILISVEQTPLMLVAAVVADIVQVVLAE